MIRCAVLALALGLTLTACVDDVGEGKEVAEVQEPVAEPVKEENAAPVTKLAIDPAVSSLKALGAKVTAVFPDFSGEVALQGDELASVSFEVQTATLQTEPEKLQIHLTEEDFLFSEKYPTATFTSTAIKAGSDAEGMTHSITGNLNIRGKVKSLTFPAKVEVTADAVAANTEFVIDRQDFEITYEGRADNLVQDNVVLTIEFSAPRAAAPSRAAKADAADGASSDGAKAGKSGKGKAAH